MAEILGVEVGTQVHNSQSLHIYKDNPITERMKGSENKLPLYTYVTSSSMNFNFPEGNHFAYRLGLVTIELQDILHHIEHIKNEKLPLNSAREPKFVRNPYFKVVARLLSLYTSYTNTERNLKDKILAFELLVEGFREERHICEDYQILAMNWFANRIPEEKLFPLLGRLEFSKDFEFFGIGKL